jgi:tryptophanyl-tRNA synthetase
MTKERILSGMRPTGKLHIGHLSVLDNWIKLQDEYECYFMAADWHALTTSFDETEGIEQSIFDMVLDWLAVGLDPEKSAIFIQSNVKEHSELFLLLSMMTPLSWLERVPTYKDQIDSFKERGKDIRTYGFLGYALLMCADILLYQATAVPVGEDQLPHIEMTREIARRFNFMYEEQVFPEPKAILGKTKLLPGIDGRKMSKSYKNEISISASKDEIWEKVRMMTTDPARIHKDDPGHPEVCTVFKYQQIYNEDERAGLEDTCRKGEIGCFKCKKILAGKLDEMIAPIRKRREALLENPQKVYDIIKDGNRRAGLRAQETMKLVHKQMHI